MASPVPVGRGQTPTVALAFTTCLSMVTIAAQAICISQRLIPLRDWRRINLTHWLILIIYFDSTLFVLASAILSYGFNLNSSQQTCSTAILLCLICYLTTKILIYYFLVEKAYIVHGVETPRLKSKSYWFNCFFMLIPYTGLAVLNIIFRIARFDENGICVIGMEKVAMIPLIVFDVVVNVYLTGLFIIPLCKLHSFKNNPHSPLRVMTVRTFIGSCCTLISSITNLTVLMVFNGEPGWVCLMLCNADILFSVLVLHWITNRDNLGRRNTVYTIGTGSEVTQMSDFHKNRVLQPSAIGTPAVSTHVVSTPVARICLTDEEVGGKGFAQSVIAEYSFVSGSTAPLPEISWKDGAE